MPSAIMLSQNNKINITILVYLWLCYIALDFIDFSISRDLNQSKYLKRRCLPFQKTTILRQIFERNELMAILPMNRLEGTSIHSNLLSRFGFCKGPGGAHLARTMMLANLQLLLEWVDTPTSPRQEYLRAIKEDNCLRKHSGKSKQLTAQHLSNLYTLDPSKTLFRVLRYFWDREPEARPLLACICVYTRDSILRLSAPFILSLSQGQPYSRLALEHYIEQRHPARFSQTTLQSTTRNVASSWTQSGHLQGQRAKLRTKAKATPAAAAYALFVSYLNGVRGLALFETEYVKLLDCTFNQLVELAETASRRGWIDFKHAGNVYEVSFPKHLTDNEKEWLREQG